MAPIPSLGSEFFCFRRGSTPRFRIPDADGSQVSETGELIERTAHIYALRRDLHPAEEVSIPIGGRGFKSSLRNRRPTTSPQVGIRRAESSLTPSTVFDPNAPGTNHQPLRAATCREAHWRTPSPNIEQGHASQMRGPGSFETTRRRGHRRASEPSRPVIRVNDCCRNRRAAPCVQ